MIRRPRLRLALPPLTSREALTLSYICSKIDDLLWTHYANGMVELLTRDPSVPGTWWSTRRDPASGGHRPQPGPIPRPASRLVQAGGKQIEQTDVRKRGR
jgi:hypothetical protein